MELSDRLEAEGPQALWLELASRTQPPPDARQNPARLLRALEKSILLARGVTGESRPPVAASAPIFALRLDRGILRTRLEHRLAGMLDAGWREEVRLLAESVPATAPCWKCIGYSELRESLHFPALPKSTSIRILEATRQYAKRQETWLRNRLDPLWIEADQPMEAIAEEIRKQLETLS